MSFGGDIPQNINFAGKENIVQLSAEENGIKLSFACDVKTITTEAIAATAKQIDGKIQCQRL